MILTHSGRGAIALLRQAWRLNERDEVLVPAYNCGSEIDPLFRGDLRPKPYRIGADAQIDLEDLAAKVGERTRVVYVTHYFGWPQPIRDVFRLCRERGIFCVEDCALSLFSKGSEHWLGQMGDAAIYSFPKSLGVPDGGALVLKTAEAIPEMELDSPAFSLMLRRSLSLLKNRSTPKRNSFSTWIRARARIDRGDEEQRTISGDHPEMLQSHYFDESTSRWGMSTISIGLLGSCDSQDVVARRRANYIHLANALRECPAVEPLFSHLPQGVCPLAMPVLVSDRDKWFRHLRMVGIMANRWWRGYHSGLSWSDYPEACTLKDRVLSLPIHQELDEDQIEYIAVQVKRIAVQV